MAPLRTNSLRTQNWCGPEALALVSQWFNRVKSFFAAKVCVLRFFYSAPVVYLVILYFEGFPCRYFYSHMDKVNL